MDAHPFFVGGDPQEYLEHDGHLQRAFEVSVLRNRREFEGEIWFDVYYKDGSVAVLQERDLVGCNIDKLLRPRPRRKRGRRKRKHAAQTQDQPTQLQPAQQEPLPSERSPEDQADQGSGGEGEDSGNVEADEDGSTA